MLGTLLLIAAIILAVTSPKKLRTLVRMVSAFVATVILVTIPPAIFQYGDPYAWGKIGGLIALLVAVIAGWWHVRSLKAAGVTTRGQSASAVVEKSGSHGQSPAD
jgi:hypothetical protein